MTQPSPKEISEAIAIVNASRETHVAWLRWYEAGHAVDEIAGDRQWQRKCIRGYDKVLSVLGRLL